MLLYWICFVNVMMYINLCVDDSKQLFFFKYLLEVDSKLQSAKHFISVTNYSNKNVWDDSLLRSKGNILKDITCGCGEMWVYFVLCVYSYLYVNIFFYAYILIYTDRTCIKLTFWPSLVNNGRPQQFYYFILTNNYDYKYIYHTCLTL